MAAAGHDVVFITARQQIEIPGVRKVLYERHRLARETTHHYIRLFENSVIYGQAVARTLLELKNEGWQPDIVVAHPGWGESLFVKDIYPNVPLINYCEYYYSGDDIEDKKLDNVFRARARNAHLLLSLESCTRGLSPTEWQKTRHPEALQSKIAVIFDGIDTDIVKPDAAASLSLQRAGKLTGEDEIITYVARNLEPHRGFPTFMRALPKILEQRPRARVLILGGDEISYGSAPEGGGTWRETMLKEVQPDLNRVHFLGKIPYDSYLRLLQISSVHVYLTLPFVLSWSCFEAMAAGGLLVASATPPVQEVIRDGENGILVSLETEAVADKVIETLEARSGLAQLRANARETIVSRYALDLCLPRQVELIEQVAA
jgi:glycosyltransferase involved in cell wall biosynthesis